MESEWNVRGMRWKGSGNKMEREWKRETIFSKMKIRGGNLRKLQKEKRAFDETDALSL